MGITKFDVILEIIVNKKAVVIHGLVIRVCLSFNKKLRCRLKKPSARRKTQLIVGYLQVLQQRRWLF